MFPKIQTLHQFNCNTKRVPLPLAVIVKPSDFWTKNQLITHLNLIIFQVQMTGLFSPLPLVSSIIMYDINGMRYFLYRWQLYDGKVEWNFHDQRPCLWAQTRIHVRIDTLQSLPERSYGFNFISMPVTCSKHSHNPPSNKSKQFHFLQYIIWMNKLVLKYVIYKNIKISKVPKIPILCR